MTIEETEELMRKSARKKARVRLVDSKGIEYTGIAADYTKADDEDRGFATFFVAFDKVRKVKFDTGEIASLKELGFYSDEITELEEI